MKTIKEAIICIWTVRAPPSVLPAPMRNWSINAAASSPLMCERRTHSTHSPLSPGVSNSTRYSDSPPRPGSRSDNILTMVSSSSPLRLPGRRPSCMHPSIVLAVTPALQLVSMHGPSSATEGKDRGRAGRDALSTATCCAICCLLRSSSDLRLGLDPGDGRCCGDCG